MEEEVRRFGWLKKLGLLILALIIVGGIVGYSFYQKIFSPNVVAGEKTYLYIPTGSELEDVVAILEKEELVKNVSAFNWVAKKKNYQSHVHAGRYQLKNGMNNDKLVDQLRSGKQEPVKVTFNNIRTKQDLAGKVAPYIEADSIDILSLINTPMFQQDYGFKAETIMCMFIPNTYKLNWNTTAEAFAKRMKKEYDNFWTEERQNKAKEIKMTREEVITLASIVKTETNKAEERPRIAGVYMNRIQRGIPLQADPTLIFAMNDFTIRRVLDKHKKIESPYNTYKYAGLPPGPICLPEISYIDAVLNYEKHNYIYFCAKEDFSGYSNFAKSLAQHNINARKYQNALNKRNIYR